VYTVSDPPGTSDTAALKKQVAELQQALAQATKGIAAMATGPWKESVTVPAAMAQVSAASEPIVPPSTSTPASTPTPAGGAWNHGGSQGRGIGCRSRDNDSCRLCGQVGQWANECKSRKSDPAVKGVTFQYVTPTRVYVHAKFHGQLIRCLLDSSCERSVIGRRCIPGVRLRKSSYALSATNKTTLPIDGDTNIHFTFDDLPVMASVSVSPAINELLLGSNWLAQNCCRWDVAAGTVYIGEKLVYTYKRERTDACRRIFVAESCIVPPCHEANIPAHMVRQGRHCYPL